jgi:hypothetical protein
MIGFSETEKQTMIANAFARVDAPEIFYKFFPVEAWLAQFLEGKSLLFSSRTAFNDPFDCRPAFGLRSFNAAVQSFRTTFRNHGFSPAESLLKAKEVARRITVDSNIVARHTQELLDRMGVLCLSARWNSALMWSHYARFHTGIYVGFHSNIDVFRIAQPVFYTDELPIILLPLIEDPILFFDTFQRKAPCWDYEEEWRIIKPPLNEAQRDEQYREQVCHTTVEEAKSLADQRGPGIYSFPKKAIASVTLGMNISADDENTVKKLVRDAGLKIFIYKVLPPSKSYTLERKMILDNL